MRETTVRLLSVLTFGVFLMGCGQGKIPKNQQEHTYREINKKKDGVSNNLSPSLKPEKKSISSIGESDTLDKEEQIKVIGKGNPENLQFYNNEGLLIKEFDVMKHNPIDDLNFPVSYINDFHFEVYDTYNQNISDEIRKRLIAPHDLNNFKSEKITSIYPQAGAYIHGEYAILFYNILTFFENEILGYRGTAYIFNKQGEIIQKFDNLNVEIWSPTITANGRYLAFKYGSDLDGSRVMPKGFRVYEIENKKIIYDEILPEDEQHPNIGYSGRIVPLGLNMLHLSIAKSTINGGKKLPNPRTIIINPSEKVCYYLELQEDPIYKMTQIEKRNLKFLDMNETGYQYRDLDTGEDILIDYETYYHKKKF